MIQLMLAKVYDENKSKIDGWYLSEKLDGVRAFWDHSTKSFYSRNGIKFNSPDWFTKDFPDVSLDGELWAGRGNFQQMGIVRHIDPIDDDWKKIKYIVFDCPLNKNKYLERMQYLESLNFNNEYIELIKIWECKNKEQLKIDHKKYEKMGAEGLIIRDPNSFYEFKRSSKLLKIKSSSNDEATVINYEMGHGRLKGLVGSLIVKNKSNKTFKVGSGLDDEIRKNPPAIGSIITYKYNDLTDAGIPRFPTFVAIRNYE